MTVSFGLLLIQRGCVFWIKSINTNLNIVIDSLTFENFWTDRLNGPSSIQYFTGLPSVKLVVHSAVSWLWLLKIYSFTTGEKFSCFKKQVILLLFCKGHTHGFRKITGLHSQEIDAGTYFLTKIICSIPNNIVVTGGLIFIGQCRHFLSQHIINS